MIGCWCNKTVFISFFFFSLPTRINTVNTPVLEYYIGILRGIMWYYFIFNVYLFFIIITIFFFHSVRMVKIIFNIHCRNVCSTWIPFTSFMYRYYNIIVIKCYMFRLYFCTVLVSGLQYYMVVLKKIFFLPSIFAEDFKRIRYSSIFRPSYIITYLY